MLASLFKSHLTFSMPAASIADVTPSHRAFAATGGPPRPQNAIGYARSGREINKGEASLIALCNEAWCT